MSKLIEFVVVVALLALMSYDVYLAGCAVQLKDICATVFYCATALWVGIWLIAGLLMDKLDEIKGKINDK